MAAPRAIGSLTIALGMVTIAVKLYTATSKREVSFNRLERKTGARTKSPIVSSVDGAELQHADLTWGYEYTPEKFVTFEPAELKALELESDPERVRIMAVVPAATVDTTHIIKSNFLGPNKGGDRAYQLLASLLGHRGHVAIGQRGGQRRDELVVIGPHISSEGLVLHECLYADEVRTSTLAEAVPTGVVLSSLEIELGGRLLDELTRPSFGAALAPLVDGGAARVKSAVDRKVAGHQIVEAPPKEVAGKPVDLLEQLRASVPMRGPKKAAPPASRLQPRRTRKAS